MKKYVVIQDFPYYCHYLDETSIITQGTILAYVSGSTMLSHCKTGMIYVMPEEGGYIIYEGDDGIVFPIEFVKDSKYIKEMSM